MNKIKLFVVTILLLLTFNIFAQQSTIKGIVTDASTNEPLPGVNILEKGTTNGTITDFNGEYSVRVSQNDAELVYSFLGFQSQTLKISGQTTINVILKSDNQLLDELVVVGYGTQKKSDLTGAIAVVDAEQMQKQSSSDMTSMLQGRASGVIVTNDGQPGANPNVRIRGINTFGDGAPLYVIDGVPLNGSPRDFNPNDIESMQVLKDASAGAIYGSRAANGVIIITTKKGKKNSPLKVSYSGYYGIDQIWQTIPVLGREDYQMIVNEVRSNAGESLLPGNDPNSPAYIDDVDTDWQKEGLKNGSRTNHNINLSGGGENITYNLSFDYFYNDGTLVGNGPDYKRYSTRANIGGEKGRFTYGTSLYYAHSHENTLTYRSDILKGNRPPLVIDLVEAVPTQKIYDENNVGGYGGTEAEIHNVISLNAIGINSMLENYTDVDRTMVSGWGQVNIFDSGNHSLDYKINLSYDKTVAHDFSFYPEFDLGYFFFTTTSAMEEANRTYTVGLVENTLNYKAEFGASKLDVLVGQMYQNTSYHGFSGYGEGLSKPYYTSLDNAKNNQSITGNNNESVLSSYLGRINYNYADKYLLTATLRRDGSSRFSKNNRYGYFPSVALGWRLMNEDFITLPEVFDDIKFRASWGQLGNQNIGDYLYQPRIYSNMPYNFNGQKVWGGLQSSVVNSDIKWETTTSTNIGLDFKLFNSRLDFSAEYYSSKTEDILVGVKIPYSVGSVDANPLVNAGSVRNSGFEFNAAWRKNTGDFHYEVSANISTLKNKVLSLGGNDDPVYGVGSKTIVGSEIGQHFGYQTEGIFQNQSEVEGHAFQSALTAPGDIIFKDQLTVDTNGDGVMDAGDGIINDEDRVFLGSAIPSITYGLNFSASYKNFDFSLFASGAAGYYINSRLYRDLMLTTDYINRHEDLLNRWTPNHTNTNIPRVVSNDPNGNQRDSDRDGWLQKGDYLRINTIQVGYNLPDNIIKGVSGARVYATLQNLYTFQAYKGYNPDFNAGTWEPGFNAGSFPKPRTYLMGVQFSF